jgi:hypothetical protein
MTNSDQKTPAEARAGRIASDRQVTLIQPGSGREVNASSNIAARLAAGYEPVMYARLALALRLLLGLGGAVRFVNGPLGICVQLAAGDAEVIRIWHPRYNVDGLSTWRVVHHFTEAKVTQVDVHGDATPEQLVAAVAGLLLDDHDAKRGTRERETVWCEAHGGMTTNPHFERPDCVHPHLTDTRTRARLNAEQ